MYKNLSNKECLIMIKELQEILDTRGECLSSKVWGICYSISLPLYEDYFTSWKHFSGSYTYPVNDREDGRGVEDQYEGTHNKWKGRQLELRLSLATHLLKCYKEYYIENFS